jgi:oxygen-independent coproporphyrinogen-3 oxidase
MEGTKMDGPLNDELRNSKDISLVYVSIPFCETRCHFCCFARAFVSDLFSLQELKSAYLKALKHEIQVKAFYFAAKHGVNLKAVNFGGGTPTLLEAQDLQDILSCIVGSFGQKVEDIKDISIEATPDSLTLSKLKQLRDAGFNRISIGAQTFQKQILNKLNRAHSVEEFFDAFDRARLAGFKNINIDLLYDIPSQTLEDVISDLEVAVRIDPEHISPSPLLPVKSVLFETGSEKNNQVLTRGNGWASRVHEFLGERGFQNYFHKYFSKVGRESITELVYSYDIPHIGIGAGAASWLGDNPTDIKTYISRPVSSGMFPKDTPHNPLRGINRMLLFPEGIYMPYFSERYGCDLEELVTNPGLELDYFTIFRNCPQETMEGIRKLEKETVMAIKGWEEKGAIEKKGDYLRITPSARFSQDAWGLYMSSI